MSEYVLLRDHIAIQKGKPPLIAGYFGADAVPYLNPEYLRGNSGAEPAKPGSDAVRAQEGETLLLWDGSNAGEFFRAKHGLVASTMAKITPDSTFQPGFFFHVVKHAEAYLKSQTSGTGIPHVDRELLEGIRTFRPTQNEQIVITQILDTLDIAIRETEALIEKLKAVKQGLLHDLLTRGIDANGQLRPPQSEAPQLYKESPLGWIPREWEVDLGVNVCREIVVGIVIKPTQYYRESGVAVLRSANVRESGLALDNLVFMSPKDHQSLSKSAVAKGDVLTVRTGYPGTSCVVDDQIEEANCVDIIISRPLPELDPSYWSTWINSDFGKKQVLAVQGGLAQQHFNVGDLMKLMVKMPPIAEQEAISDRLRGVLSRIDSESKEQSKLFALKAALMDDLLTGRVRVTPLLEFEQRSAAQIVQQSVGQTGA